MDDKNQFLKIIVVGDQNVGKTCLLNQFCFKQFDHKQVPTIGCDFTQKAIDYKGTNINIQLWDIAGQERYISVSKLYVRNAIGCIVVCSADDEKSLEKTIKWKKIVEENSQMPNNTTIPIILVQNKMDLIQQDNKPLEDYQTIEVLKQFANNYGFNDCFQVSAKNDQNISEMIMKLLELVLQFCENNNLQDQNGFMPDQDFEKTKNLKKLKQQQQQNSAKKLSSKSSQKKQQQKSSCC